MHFCKLNDPHFWGEVHIQKDTMFLEPTPNDPLFSTKSYTKCPPVLHFYSLVGTLYCYFHIWVPPLHTRVKVKNDRPGTTFYTQWPLVHLIYSGTRSHFQLTRDLYQCTALFSFLVLLRTFDEFPTYIFLRCDYTPLEGDTQRQMQMQMGLICVLNESNRS